MTQLSKSLFLVGAAVLIFATAAYANTVSMELIAPPPSPWPALGGVYISPYTAIIGDPGQTQPVISGVDTLVICDDFTTDVSISTMPWQALITNVASLQGELNTSTAVKFDHTVSATQQQQDYTVAAYLAVEIMQAMQSGDTTKQGELSFALWGLFDPTSMDANGPLSGHWITGTTLTDAQNDLNAAVMAVMNQNLMPSNFANVSIYTPTPNQNVSQEYLVVTTPEASAAAVLAVDVSALFAFIGLLRKCMLRQRIS